MKTLPVASSTASEVKFSLAISSSCECWRSSLVLDRFVDLRGRLRPGAAPFCSLVLVSLRTVLLQLRDLGDAARVTAAGEFGVQENVDQFGGALLVQILRAEREHVGVVVLAGQPHFVFVTAPAPRARPSILLAAIAIPTPVEQTRMPRSARPCATSRPTRCA